MSRQQYDPWGKVRTGGISVVDLNYTGQRKDDTGLLYYHARYYDPSLARFVSPDSIVPGASSGTGGAGGVIIGEQNSVLTVDFHDDRFVPSVDPKNAQGPANPQALSRYSYVLNNPLRYVDPLGHWRVEARHATKMATELHDAMSTYASQIRNEQSAPKIKELFSALANMLDGRLQALVEIFLDNWNEDYSDAYAMLDMLDWMENSLRYLGDDDRVGYSPDDYISFEILEDGWDGVYMEAHWFLTPQGEVPRVRDRVRLPRSLYHLLNRDRGDFALGSPEWPVRWCRGCPAHTGSRNPPRSQEPGDRRQHGQRAS